MSVVQDLLDYQGNLNRSLAEAMGAIKGFSVNAYQPSSDADDIYGTKDADRDSKTYTLVWSDYVVVSGLYAEPFWGATFFDVITLAEPKLYLPDDKEIDEGWKIEISLPDKTATFYVQYIKESAPGVKVVYLGS